MKNRLELLVAAAKAGREALLRELPGAMSSRQSKGPRDYATAADIASEKAVKRALKSIIGPDLRFIGEETTALNTVVPKNAIVTDPFDGTVVGSRGAADYGIAVGELFKGKPLRGVLLQPTLNRLVKAEVGKGCWLNDQKVILSPAESPNKLIIGINIGPEVTLQKFDALVRSIVKDKSALQFRCLGTAVGAEIEMLLGITDCYLAPGAKIWDVTAAAAAVAAAGGVVCDLNGREPRWNKVSVSMMFARSAAIAERLLWLFHRKSRTRL